VFESLHYPSPPQVIVMALEYDYGCGTTNSTTEELMYLYQYYWFQVYRRVTERRKFRRQQRVFVCQQLTYSRARLEDKFDSSSTAKKKTSSFLRPWESNAANITRGGNMGQEYAPIGRNRIMQVQLLATATRK
jgi:hypothetical protein